MIVDFGTNDWTKPVYGLDQYDYGQQLELHGLSLPESVEVHFAIDKSTAEAERRVGITKDGVTTVAIPDKMLEQSKPIIAYIYVSDSVSGKTVRKVTMPINPRQKPQDFVSPDDPLKEDPFRDAVMAVADAAERAEASGKSAEAWAHGSVDYPEREEDNARYYAEQAGADAERAEQVYTCTEKELAVFLANAANYAVESKSAKEAAEGFAEAAEGHKNDAEKILNDVENVGAAKVKEINNAGSAQLSEINNTGGSQVEAINNAGVAQLETINNTGSAQLEAINNVGEEQITKANEAIEKKGAETLGSIPEDYAALQGEVTELKGDLADLRGDIWNVKTETKTLQYEDLTWENGYLLTDGTLREHSAFKTSLMVETKSGDVINYDGLRNTYASYPIIASYNKDREFLFSKSLESDGSKSQTGAFTVPEEVCYVRFVTYYYDSSIKIFNSITMPYTTRTFCTDDLSKEVDAIRQDVEENASLIEKNTADIHELTNRSSDSEYVNLINPSKLKKGYYIVTATGEYKAGSWSATEKITLKPNTKYYFGGMYGNSLYAFYNSDGVFIENHPTINIENSQIYDNNYFGWFETGDEVIQFAGSMQEKNEYNCFLSEFYTEYKPYGTDSSFSNKYILKLTESKAGKKVLVVGDSISTGSSSARLSTNMPSYAKYEKWVDVLIADGYFSVETTYNCSQHATGFVARQGGDDWKPNSDYLGRVKWMETQGLDLSTVDLVIVFGGINDFKLPCELGESGSDDTTKFIPALEKFYAYIFEKCINARICTLLPMRCCVASGGEWTIPDGYIARRNSLYLMFDQYLDAIKTVIGKYNIPYLDLANQSGFNAENKLFRDRWTYNWRVSDGLIDGDGIHPNEEYQKRFLAPMIKHSLDGMGC